VHLAAEPDVGQHLDDVSAADVRAVDEVFAFTTAVKPARDGELGELERTVAVLVVEEELDLGEGRRLAPVAACVQDVVGLPAAQTIASETFDLPEPFGPTTTATPGSRRTSTGSGNDLKPRSLIARRCTRPQSDDQDGRAAVSR
jgi:hypothetical protein